VSSTNRGGQRSSADNYATPSWCTRRILEVPGLFPTGGVWLDPCAGDGSIIRATNSVRSDINEWRAVEIRSECEEQLVAAKASVQIQDFFDSATDEVDVVFTNPPYRLAMEFVEACLPIAKLVVMLLRVNFVGSEKRSSFFRGFAPDIHILPNRPSFCNNQHGRPSTDSPEYGWFCWHGIAPRSRGTLQVLASTPKAERQAG
jgi:hypothetical protein